MKWVLALAEMARRANALYVDPELPSAQRQLDDPEAFLLTQRHRLVILDEVQSLPDLFAVLLQQASESLAGRVAQLELTPFQASEVMPVDATSIDLNPLWVRGGFPLSWLPPDNAASLRWRDALIATYLERDIAALVPRIPATTLRRQWTMLAHVQGGMFNQSQFAASLAFSGQTVARYIDILSDLMLICRLPAWHGNVGKRLVRAPKVYVRNSGIVHASSPGRR